MGTVDLSEQYQINLEKGYIVYISSQRNQLNVAGILISLFAIQKLVPSELPGVRFSCSRLKVK